MSLRVLLKRLQRQLYTLLLHPLGCFASVVVVALLAAWTFAQVLGGSFSPGQQLPPAKGVWIDFADNIGGVDMQHHLAYGPIDVVYTWVNGSDPRWLKKKKLWEERMFGPQLPVPETNDTGNATQIDDSRSANRYRDSQELRYSLRSLVKYAPWIRKIYLVTDNQIPHWLNLEAERLHVVSHEEIFPNESHLPVFSSPAIETHLHRLPGLSDKFIYFNDDVMLGAPTFPEDFVSTSGTQKVYLSWEVPKCAPGCSEGWIGDGYCDRACNVSECNFDYPDCVNTTDSSSGRFRNGGGGDNRRQSTVQCSKGCPDSWLGDRVCDNRCAKEECAFDVGDCGINAFADKLPGVMIRRDNAFIVTKKAGAQENKDQLREFANTVPAFAGDPPVAMSVPAGTTAAYFNLSQVFSASANLTFEKAIFSNAELVHNAIFIKMHRILVVLFYHGQEGAPPAPPLPTHAVFTLAATEGNYTTTAIFRAVMLPKHAVDATAEIPEQMGLVEGFVSTCNRISVPETAGVEVYDKFLSTIPFRSSSRASTDEGIALHVRLRGPRFPPRLPARNVLVRSTVTFPGNASSVVLHYPLVVVAGMKSQYSDMSLTVKDLSRDFELPPPDDRAALERWQMVTPPEDRLGRFQAELKQAAVNDTIDMRLALPIPKAWAEMEDKAWIHHQVELLIHPNEGPDQDSYTATCLVAMHSWGTAREPEPEQPKTPSEPESVLPNLGFTTQPLGNNNTTSNNNAELRADRRRRLQQADPLAEYPIRIVADNGDDAQLVHGLVSDRRSPRRLRTELQLSDVDELLQAEQAYLQTRALLPTSVQVPSSNEAGLLAADNWWMRVLQQFTLQQEVAHLTPPQTPRDQPYGQQQRRRRSRRLQDTYAKSLVHVNRLYTKAFGVEQRKVPAHMPHMIDKHIMSEMQERWKEEWEATSTHRFRSPNDMQYAFAYFFYVMNRNKLIELNVIDYLSTEVDTNHDGIIDKNEQRTLAALMTKEVITQQDLDALEFCIAPPHLQAEARENRTVLADYPASIADAANCTLVQDAIQKNARRPPTHEVGPAEEVSFEMIGDDFNHSITQLDSIRHRRTKFICVNDDMKNPSPELLKAFSAFYEALFPLPCQFELPKGQANPTLYLDEYRALTAKTAAAAASSASAASALALDDILSVLTDNRRAIAFGLCVVALVAFVALKQRRPKDDEQARQHRHREEERSPKSPKSDQPHQPATRRPTARKSASKH